jgi:glycosyltransferase involved in cell wall biosynthesis
MTEVSVVIPTKNEEKTIGIRIEKIQKVFREYHIGGEETIALYRRARGYPVPA